MAPRPDGRVGGLVVERVPRLARHVDDAVDGQAPHRLEGAHLAVGLRAPVAVDAGGVAVHGQAHLHGADVGAAGPERQRLGPDRVDVDVRRRLVAVGVGRRRAAAAAGRAPVQRAHASSVMMFRSMSRARRAVGGPLAVEAGRELPARPRRLEARRDGRSRRSRPKAQSRPRRRRGPGVGPSALVDGVAGQDQLAAAQPRQAAGRAVLVVAGRPAGPRSRPSTSDPV